MCANHFSHLPFRHLAARPSAFCQLPGDKSDKNLDANDKNDKNLCADDKNDKNLCADDKTDQPKALTARPHMSLAQLGSSHYPFV